MTTKTETWLDVMVALPLARGVPTENEAETARGIVVWEDRGRIVVADEENGTVHAGPMDGWLVDLDDPQGQRYAVNAWLRTQMEGSRKYAGKEPRARRLLRGNGTGADRLWLAKRLAEVTS